MGTRTITTTCSPTKQTVDWFVYPASRQICNESPIEVIAVVLPFLVERRLITDQACQAVIDHIRVEQRSKVVMDV